jgi:Ran-binding protein 9/10
MGIGLSTGEVNLNRLPGWDKGSYGYHGDDGHSFCSSGSGYAYGPTFTTGDYVGCCVNFLENSCFYTRNGYNLGKYFPFNLIQLIYRSSLLGTSFRDIPV